MTNMAQNSSRKESNDVTYLHDLHERLIRGEENAAEIAEIEKLIVESSEDLEPFICLPIAS